MMTIFKFKAEQFLNVPADEQFILKKLSDSLLIEINELGEVTNLFLKTSSKAVKQVIKHDAYTEFILN